MLEWPVRFTGALGAVAVVGYLFLTVPMAKVPWISCLGQTDGFRYFALSWDDDHHDPKKSVIMEVDFVLVAWLLVSTTISWKPCWLLHDPPP